MPGNVARTKILTLPGDPVAPRLGEFLRLQVKRNGLSLLPRARPFWPILRIDELAAKALAKLLGVRALREAKHVHVHAVAVEGMPARA